VKSRYFLQCFEPSDASSGSGSPAAPSSANAGSSAGGAASEPLQGNRTAMSVFGDSSGEGDSPKPAAPTPANGGAEGETANEVSGQPVAPKAQVAAPVQQPVPQAGMTPEQIATLAAQTAAQFRQTQQQPAQENQQAQFSEEEFNTYFKVPKVDAARFTAIFGYEPPSAQNVQHLQNFGQDLVRQAVAITQHVLQQEKQNFQSQLAPVVQQHKQSQDTQLESELFSLHPALKDFKPLLNEISSAAQREGRTFTNKTELFNFLADRAKGLLGTAFPTQQVQQVNTNGSSPAVNATRRTMTPTMTGGIGSGKPGSASVQNTAKAIFGS